MRKSELPWHYLYKDPWEWEYYDDSQWVDPTRTHSKLEYPYAYDEFFLFGSRAVLGDNAAYSDRLYQWDYAKTEQLWKEHCEGFGFRNVPVDKLSNFMSAWQGKKVRVTGVAEGCNPSNGYPYWITWYRDVPEEVAQST